ncbi:hypothetical protein R6Y99_05370 [Pseudomonas lundensis]|uniref:hypothetical protein n=1 Tax=Serratia proteamaculans TaxID=28151 RepID=UPI00298184CB|nr:hypothetical protein [Serratia proteamaculans]MDW5499219.1 hypothetical protein [Serratia proteamaculans]MDW5504281.1 hypothetical protein [Pseudomonas lundensis]
MVERNAVLPAAWNALVNALCQQAPYLRATLVPEIARFSQARRTSGWLSAAFNTSLLGYNGCPLEFTVSSSKPQALSCTMDPFLPRYAEDRGVEAFYRHYQQLTASPADESGFEKVSHMQKQSIQALRFGSWLGRKYAPEAVKTKVYSEVPPDWPGGATDDPAADGQQAGLLLLMIGYYPELTASPREYYFQWHSARITHAEIAAVMAFFGGEGLYPALAPLLDSALQQTLSGEGFPPTTYGFSLVYGPNGELESFTLFTMAASFFGDNSRVYPAVQTLLTQNGQAMPLLQGVITAQVPLQFNVVGFSVDMQGHQAISCTFSPQNTHFEALPFHPSPPAKQAAHPRLTALLKQQCASGAFASHVRTPDGRWHQDENAFVTAQVLRTLDYTPQTAPYIEKALDFLIACETRPFHFSFWPSAAHPQWMANQSICVDIDDTAIITELLYKFGRISLSQVRQTISHMNAYQVRRVDPRQAAEQHQWAECQSFHTWMKDDNDIRQLDCCVNTNALILINILVAGSGAVFPAYRRIIQMLNQAVQWSGDSYDRLSTLTPYYAHPSEWRATLEYARLAGIPQLTPVIEALTRWQWPADPMESPLYRRHDGRFLWTSSCLNTFRSLAQSDCTEDTHEYLSQ